MTRLVGDRDVDVFAREELLEVLLQDGDARVDNQVVVLAPVAPQTIRLTVPAPLPSTRISRGLTTTASATAGLVTAIRVMSKSRNEHRRSSGGEQHALRPIRRLARRGLRRQNLLPGDRQPPEAPPPRPDAS